MKNIINAQVKNPTNISTYKKTLALSITLIRFTKGIRKKLKVIFIKSIVELVIFFLHESIILKTTKGLS